MPDTSREERRPCADLRLSLRGHFTLAIIPWTRLAADNATVTSVTVVVKQPPVEAAYEIAGDTLLKDMCCALVEVDGF